MRSYLSKSVNDFHSSDDGSLLLELINSSGGFDLQDTQRAWEGKFQFLRMQF